MALQQKQIERRDKLVGDLDPKVEEARRKLENTVRRHEQELSVDQEALDTLLIQKEALEKLK